MGKLVVICNTIILALTIILVGIPQTSIDADIAMSIIPSCVGIYGMIIGHHIGKKKEE